MGSIGELLPDTSGIFLFAPVAPVWSPGPQDLGEPRALQDLAKRQESARLVTTHPIELPLPVS
jgi:hypothetical protein